MMVLGEDYSTIDELIALREIVTNDDMNWHEYSLIIDDVLAIHYPHELAELDIDLGLLRDEYFFSDEAYCYTVLIAAKLSEQQSLRKQYADFLEE